MRLEFRILELALENEDSTHSPREGQKSAQGHTAVQVSHTRPIQLAQVPTSPLPQGCQHLRGTGSHLSTEVLPYLWLCFLWLRLPVVNRDTKILNGSPGNNSQVVKCAPF